MVVKGGKRATRRRVFFCALHRQLTQKPLSFQQIGVVSDFDLLPLDVALDDAPGSTFPAPGAEWAPFLAVKEAAAKAAATRVADVMTADPVVVAGGASLAAAARTLLAKRVRRLPVVDEGGRLIGLFSRSDLLKTAWAGRHGGGEGGGVN